MALSPNITEEYVKIVAVLGGYEYHSVEEIPRVNICVYKYLNIHSEFVSFHGYVAYF
jgi:hypothetical protein